MKLIKVEGGFLTSPFSLLVITFEWCCVTVIVLLESVCVLCECFFFSSYFSNKCAYTEGHSSTNKSYNYNMYKQSVNVQL